MTKKELMEIVLPRHVERMCDTAIPQNIYDILNNLGIEDISYRFVMGYDTGSGKLIDLYAKFFEIFKSAPSLYKETEALMTDCKDRGDCWDFDLPDSKHNTENMLDDFRAVEYHLEKIREKLPHTIK